MSTFTYMDFPAESAALNSALAAMCAQEDRVRKLKAMLDSDMERAKAALEEENAKHVELQKVAQTAANALTEAIRNKVREHAVI